MSQTNTRATQNAGASPWKLTRDGPELQFGGLRPTGVVQAPQILCSTSSHVCLVRGGPGKSRALPLSGRCEKRQVWNPGHDTFVGPIC